MWLSVPLRRESASICLYYLWVTRRVPVLALLQQPEHLPQTCESQFHSGEVGPASAAWVAQHEQDLRASGASGEGSDSDG